MFSKSHRSSNLSRRHKSLISNNLSIETLERREMFVANLFANAVVAWPMNDAGDAQPAVVAPPAPTTGDGPSLPSGPTATLTLTPVLTAPTTVGVFVDPPTPPELGATFEEGVLTITGSNNADHLYVFATDGEVHVREVVQDVTLITVPVTDLQSIVVNAYGGDDWVTIDDQSINIKTFLRGGTGDDTLQGGRAGDKLYGDSGNDKLVGRGGNDMLDGGYGDDLLVGGDGDDIIHGRFGNDYLLGGAGNDWLLGGEGSDQMFGEAGKDLLVGGSGQNLMDGGTGDDTIFGGDDIDGIYGGDGDDFIRGSDGDDRIHGEGGNDYIFADNGNDLIDGGEGDDSIAGGLGNDLLGGGPGNDTLSGGPGQDWLDGAAGHDLLVGGTGDDWLQGGLGNDQLNGGSGDDQEYQDYADRQDDGVVYFSWSDIKDFAGDIWDGVTDFFEWTWDKASTIANRFYGWATELDDRVFRLGDNMADALSNWPWEADFWKGLGRSAINVLEIYGLAEAWEIAFEILKPWQRGMTSAEKTVARGVFGDSIDLNQVRLDEHSLMAALGRTHVTGYIINSTENIDDPKMIHELTHVWQYEQDGLVYIPEAIDAQKSDEKYDYGGLNGLRDKMAAGQGLSAYNPEQQGAIVADYFMLRQYARNFEPSGYIPLSIRQDLDVYIHFVQEVSTLTPEELDVQQVITIDPATVFERTPTDGQNGASKFDQRGRGFARVANGGNGLRIDIGTYEAQSAPSADFVDDGFINGADFLAWQRGFGATTGATRADGDADNDDDVDSSDLAAWQVTFGQAETNPLAAAATSGNEVGSGQSAVVLGQEAGAIKSVPNSALTAELIDAAIALASAGGDPTRVAAPLVDQSFAVHFPDRYFEPRELALASQANRVEATATSPSESEATKTEDQWLSNELLELVFG